MQSIYFPLIFSIFWVLGLVLSIELGRYLAQRFEAHGYLDEKSSFGPLEGALFALFGLLVAFSFSGAASRFDMRREMIAQESNEISTAYLRIDLLSEETQPILRNLYGRYLESRLETYRVLPDVDAALQELKRTEDIQRAIWGQALEGSRSTSAHPDAAKLLMPALNSMFDVVTTRTMAMRIHPPGVIFGMLFFVGLVCSLFIGFRSAREKRSRLRILIYAIATGVCFFAILDLEFPRGGRIRVDE